MINQFALKWQSLVKRSHCQRLARRAVFRCEQLEDRRLLAVVTSLNDSGAGTLREALAGADPVITFAVSGTIDVVSELTINRSVVIDGTGQTVTVNNVTPGSRVFLVNDGSVASVRDVVIRTLTITGGNILSTSPLTSGGAVRNAENLTLDDVVVSGNSARFGGAVVALPNSILTINNSSLSDNVAEIHGGAVHVQTGSTVMINASTLEGNATGVDNIDDTLRLGGAIGIQFGTVTITNSTLSGNSAITSGAPSQLGFGGAIGLSGGTLTVIGSDISNNDSDRGGGLALRNGSILIQGSAISDNTSLMDGGGVRLRRSSAGDLNVTIEDSTISGNTAVAGTGGGGISSWTYTGSEIAASNLTVRRSTITDNYSTTRGGGVVQRLVNASFENVTISGNSSVELAGGLLAFFSGVYDDSSTISFSTMTGNTATLAGGMYTISTNGLVNVSNSILSGNTDAGPTIPDLYDISPSTSVVTYSVIGSANGHAFADGVAGNIVGTPANLGALADNGGLTHTHELLAGPGIGAADPSATLAVDQRGFSRPGADGMRDMGAFESDGTDTITLDFNGDGNYDCGDMDLLNAAIAGGVFDPNFDVNGDNMLTSADVFQWLIDAGELRFGAGRSFLFGDANLDGIVDGQDFLLWNNNKFTTNNRWCVGNFNQDAVVDGQDFLQWNNNKFMSSDAAPLANQNDAVARAERSVTQRPTRDDWAAEDLMEGAEEFENEALPVALLSSPEGTVTSQNESAPLQFSQTDVRQIDLAWGTLSSVSASNGPARIFSVSQQPTDKAAHDELFAALGGL